jgi:hypothetical protein
MRLLLLCLLLLAACTSPPPEPTPSATSTPPPTVVPAPTTAYPWTDERAVMNGLCFESVYDAAGQTFVLDSAEELTHFFNLADNSHLCRRPVQRAGFDFRDNRRLAGLWTRGLGCTAHHEVRGFEQDDVARTFVIVLRFVTEGECGYELVQPFWVGLSLPRDYDIRIRIE